ncbi:MAG: guanylate kinase [Dehalococcoidales bacterium]|nr:guanylate kinase [Dehalococcoidales bacterium]
MSILKTQKVFLISGPSAVGKDTVIDIIKKKYTNFHYVITAVTRKPRTNEKEGINHFFLNNKEFTNLINNDELLEWSKVYKNYYGVPKNQIYKPLCEGKNVLLRVDVQGAKKLKKILPNIIMIFIKPESIDSIKNHLLAREKKSESDIRTRLDSFASEMEYSKYFDHIVTNIEDKIEYVVSEVEDIIKSNI